MSFTDLASAGFDILELNHANAVLEQDFPEPTAELSEILLDFTIQVEELVRRGGGEAPFTQRLGRAFEHYGWQQREITIGKTIDGEERESTTHIIDHVRSTDAGLVAMEIEWNNKDPFYDRDLENFQRLHHEGAISVGVIITRGSSLQSALRQMVLGFAQRRQITGFDDLIVYGYRPTETQRRQIEGRLSDSDFATEWSRAFVSSKFGTSTTHWNKLLERVNRGVGNPCPLLLLGIPTSSVHQIP
ncbi:MAG: restriction endonuclease [Chloroflexi bacterium]|nr:restriction endonuclease [Chloroflexota bacterium]